MNRDPRLEEIAGYVHASLCLQTDINPEKMRRVAFYVDRGNDDQDWHIWQLWLQIIREKSTPHASFDSYRLYLDSHLPYLSDPDVEDLHVPPDLIVFDIASLAVDRNVEEALRRFRALLSFAERAGVPCVPTVHFARQVFGQNTAETVLKQDLGLS